MASLNEDIAGVWELHPVVELSTLRRSVVNFQGTSFRWSHRGKTEAARVCERKSTDSSAGKARAGFQFSPAKILLMSIQERFTHKPEMCCQTSGFRFWTAP